MLEDEVGSLDGGNGPQYSMAIPIALGVVDFAEQLDMKSHRSQMVMGPVFPGIELWQKVERCSIGQATCAVRRQAFVPSL